MIEYTNDGAVVRNSMVRKGAPAVRIVGDGITFTNAGTGRLISESADSPALAIEGAGALVLNKAGGVIENLEFGKAITGSAFADTIVNEGTIEGDILLGGGSDSYTERGAPRSWGLINFGSGNDVYRLETDVLVANLDGGVGTDRLVLDVETYHVAAVGVTGFERLEVGSGISSLQGFSGFLDIVLSPGRVNVFTDSDNPGADVKVKGGTFVVGAGSTFRNITGTSAADAVEVWSSAFEPTYGTILGNVSLGGGDDIFSYQWVGEGPAPVVSGGVFGGSGNNELRIVTDGDKTLDLSNFVGFRKIDNALESAPGARLRLLHADGFEQIWAANQGTFILAESHSPAAHLLLPFLPGAIILEDTATVGSVGRYFVGLENAVDADPSQSWSLTNAGNVVADVWMYLGHDRYDGSAGAVGGTIFGFAGDDALIGGVGSDRIDGGYGNDVLQGNRGADVLSGGFGADTFVYATAGDSAAVASDQIVGFETGIDKVDLRPARASSVTWTQSGDSNLVTVETTTGTLSLTIGGTIALADFLLPQGMVLGRAGDDQLTGTDADDVFDGGLGADTMIGLLGNDYYFVDSAADKAVEGAGAGTDTVESSVSFTLVANVENLALVGSAVKGIGNALANLLTGNAAANILNGGSGADRMSGGAGNDTYFVDASADKAVESVGGGLDTVRSSASFSLGGNVENLTLTRADAVDGIGNALANLMLGNGAANRLRGGGGVDKLKGGGGADHLHGGKQGDTLKGEAGADRFYFDSALAPDNVDHVLDFTRGADKIVLENAIFRGVGSGTFAATALVVGTKAADANDRIIYNPSSGALFFDPDGSGSAAAVKFAVLDTQPASLSASDFLVI